jgi:L-ascorbate metabolism protein UlaG (beta-lactamase superfamily)
MRTHAAFLLLASFAALAPACSRASESAGESPAPRPSASTKTEAPPPSASAAPSAATSAAPASSGTSVDGRPADGLATSLGELKIVPIHHGSVLFELAGKSYYVDPFHEGNLDGLPKADVIFITHAHPDHLDPAALEAIRKPSTLYVCPPSVAEKLPLPRKSEGNPIVVKTGERKNVAGVGVEAVPMYNLKRGPSAGKLYHDKGWGEGFVLTFGDKRVYLSGDTECTPEMKALKDIDIAFVCMNLPYTMTPTEAAECVAAFKPKVVYPYHYRGADLGEFDKGLAETKGVEVRKRAWY